MNTTRHTSTLNVRDRLDNRIKQKLDRSGTGGRRTSNDNTRMDSCRFYYYDTGTWTKAFRHEIVTHVYLPGLTGRPRTRATGTSRRSVVGIRQQSAPSAQWVRDVSGCVEPQTALHFTSFITRTPTSQRFVFSIPYCVPHDRRPGCLWLLRLSRRISLR